MYPSGRFSAAVGKWYSGLCSREPDGRGMPIHAVPRWHLGMAVVAVERFRYGREYGFGWSLLTTPEQLIGREACLTDSAPEDSYQRMVEHLAGLLPNATEKQIKKLLK